MKRSASRCRGDVRRTRVNASRPTLEGLEDRLLLYAVSGGAWTYGSRITYSFMPDGTNVGGLSSNLYSTLNADYPTTTWETQIEQAFAVWEQVAHINLTLVSDNGAADGVSGDQQDDPRFGDIRIGAVPQGAGTLAVTFLPPPFNGGTAAGDIVFNSSVNWSSTGYDLETVAIHEIGHALGMGHSAITTAVMYAYYNGFKQSLTSDDVAGIQSIYGAVPADGVSNGRITTATNITGDINGNDQIALSSALVAPTDSDFYVVTVPSNTTGTMVVTLQSTNLSSLSPAIVVYNGLYEGLTRASSTSYGATVSATITGVTANQTYYFRVLSATGGVGSVGAYGLLVNFGSGTQSPVSPPNTLVAGQPDEGGGGESLTATAKYAPHGRHHLAEPQNVLGGLSGHAAFLRAHVTVLLRHHH